MSDLSLDVLKKIAVRADDNSRTRWVIITEMASELCVKLKKDGKQSSEIAEESRGHLKKLQNIFLQLAQEGKVELDEKTGRVKLTDAGQKVLEESTTKIVPP